MLCVPSANCSYRWKVQVAEEIWTYQPTRLTFSEFTGLLLHTQMSPRCRLTHRYPSLSEAMIHCTQIHTPWRVQCSRTAAAGRPEWQVINWTSQTCIQARLHWPVLTEGEAAVLSHTSSHNLVSASWELLACVFVCPEVKRTLTHFSSWFLQKENIDFFF